MISTEDLERRLIDAARQAAPAFGIEPSHVAILNRSENAVCAITSQDGSRSAMRLHRPGYNTADELRSEVQWVAALADADIPVPRPMATRDGGFYTPVMIDLGAGPVEHQVGVIEWVDGRPLGDPLDAGEQDRSHHYARIGELCAQIRRQTTAWDLPAGFVRRRWDAEGFVGSDPLWDRFWEAPTLSAGQRELLTAAREEMFSELSSRPTTPDRFGLIHADLHLGNVMADGDELTLIDFDDAGFGWYAWEIAVSLHNVLDEPWYPAARAAMFDGYQRVHDLAGDEVELVDILLVMRSLMLVGWLSARPELPAYEHLPDIVDQAVTAATSYLT